MKIADYDIVKGCKPYIICEISCSHNGSINNAIDLIKAAKWAGADCVKLQCYTPDSITLDCKKPDFIIQDGLWRGRTLYDLYSAAYTPPDWFPKLFKVARQEKITIFSSVFSHSAVELMEKMGVPAYKIASFEIVDIPLIEHAARTGKPLIISTGLAKNKEVLDANTASGGHAAFLHCTSDYPGTIEFSDLDRINRLRALLGPDALVGLSDHTPDNAIVPSAATALGAVIIEKHIKMKGDNDSEDAKFSLDPAAFRALVTNVQTTWEALKQRENAGNPSQQFRRSLYAVADIAEGETFTEDNIRSIRPGYGLPPRYLPKLLGKRSDRSYRRGDRIT